MNAGIEKQAAPACNSSSEALEKNIQDARAPDGLLFSRRSRPAVPA